MNINHIRAALYKFFRWEFWPFKILCLPLLPWWLFYSARLRSFFFFRAANPEMPYGGMFASSRFDTLQLLPLNLVPATTLIEIKQGFEKCLQKIQESGIQYPCIVKPDSGMKALAVGLIDSSAALKNYFDKMDQNFLVQEFVQYPKEIGIFYCRKPGQERGTITGIVEKEHLHILGNGVKTLEYFIHKNSRTLLQKNVLVKKLSTRLSEVPEDDEYVLLDPIASHLRGTKFTDRTFKKNNHLIKQINQICRKIPGFYYGRIDIRYQTFDELCRGEHFTIVDLNGASSIPLHIYDSKHTIFFAWREILKHWRWLFDISKINRQRGHDLMNRSEGWAMMKKMSSTEKALKKIVL